MSLLGAGGISRFILVLENKQRETACVTGVPCGQKEPPLSLYHGFELVKTVFTHFSTL